MQPTTTTTSKVTIDPYNSRTGAGTLSYYAKKYNTTPEKLLEMNKENKSIKDINTIYEGGTLNVPTPLVQSTNGVDKDIADASTKLDSALGTTPNTSTDPAKNQNSPTGGGKTSVVSYRDNPDGTTTNYLSDGKTSRVRYTKNPDGTLTATEVTEAEGGPVDRKQLALDAFKKGETDFNKIAESLNTGSAGGGQFTADEVGQYFEEYSPGSAGLLAEYNNYSQQIQPYYEALEKARENSSAASLKLIDSIKEKFATRVEEMDETNARMEGVQKVLGYRSGRARYAGEIQAGILANEEQEGIMRIAALNSEEISLIAQAEQARASDDYKSLVDSMNILEKVHKEKESTLLEIHKRAVERQQAEIKAKQDLTKNLIESTKLAEGIAPSILEGLKTLKSPDEKAAYVEQVAVAFGLNPIVLESALVTVGQDLRKEELNLNILSKRAGVTPTTNTPKPKSPVSKDKTGKPKYDPVNIGQILKDGLEADGVKYNGRGSDKYVDPNLYLNIYTTTKETFGDQTAKKFLKDFPPSTELNPKAFETIQFPQAIKDAKTTTKKRSS